MTRTAYTLFFTILLLTACGKTPEADGAPSTDTTMPPVEDATQDTAPDEHRVQQGTVLNLDEMRIGIINVQPESAWLALLAGSAPEERVELKVGEEIVRGTYRITNLGTREDKLVGPWTPPGGDQSYVRLKVETLPEAPTAETDVQAMLDRLVDPAKTLDEAGIRAVIQQVEAADDILGIRKIEVMAGDREQVGIDESGRWPVGIDARNGRPLKAIYYCEDVCPRNSNLVLIYDDATPEDCSELGGIKLESMFGGFIACKPQASGTVTVSVPQGDEIRDERTPAEACEPSLEQYPGCRLMEAERIDASVPDHFERCAKGGSVAGCFSCTFECNQP